MQAITCFVQPLFPSKCAINDPSTLVPCPVKPAIYLGSPRRLDLKVASLAYETSTVDYNSAFSVFPAEACETIGGEACAPYIYPEAKLIPEFRDSMTATSANKEDVEREYFDYSDHKSVLKGEACDDLGGEFCEAPYKRGVY